MSVGHFARVLEAAGIPTVMVCIQAAWVRVKQMKLARVVVVPHFMGRTLGPPGQHRRHRATIVTALNLLENAVRGETMVELSGSYRSGVSG